MSERALSKFTTITCGTNRRKNDGVFVAEDSKMSAFVDTLQKAVKNASLGDFVFHFG